MKIYKWQTAYGKEAPHHISAEKYKLRQQWNTTTHLLEPPKIWNTDNQTLATNENSCCPPRDMLLHTFVEQRERSFIAKSYSNFVFCFLFFFCFKFFIIHHGCTIWDWLNTTGFQFFFEYFPDYYMQVTMKISGILKFWNSEQALTWRKTLSFTDIHIYNQCCSTGTFCQLRSWLLTIFQRATVVK